MVAGGGYLDTAGRDPAVALVDLTCRSPAYDRRLGGALSQAGASVGYWVSGCLPAQAEELDLVGPRSGLDLAGRLTLRFPRLRRTLKTGEYAVNVAALNLAVRRGRYDVVHLQWLPLAELWPGVAAREVRALRRGGVPVVLTVHNALPHDRDIALHRLVRVYRAADALVCHTRSSARQLAGIPSIRPARVRYIPHGPIDLDGEGDVTAGSAERPSADGPTVLVFGFLRPYKGIETLLEAWPGVLERVPSAALRIVGSGPAEYVTFLADRVRELDIGSSVRLERRFLPEAELAGRIAAADVLAFPYYEITQSGALLAGLAAGRAVVASDLDGFRETIRDGETGLLVPPGDRESLSRAVIRLLEAPALRERLGRTAARDVHERFGWDRVARRTLELYRDLVSGSSRAPEGEAE